MTIGGTARITSATITLTKPMPRNASPIEMIARLGSARPMFDALIAMNEPRCRCPRATPSGIAMTMLTPIAANDSSRCSTVLVSMKWRLSPMNWNASMMECISPPWPAPTA